MDGYEGYKLNHIYEPIGGCYNIEEIKYLILKLSFEYAIRIEVDNDEIYSILKCLEDDILDDYHDFIDIIIE